MEPPDCSGIWRGCLGGFERGTITMKYWLNAALQRLNRLAPTKRVAIPAVLLMSFLPLVACDPRGSASVEQLMKRAQEQRSAGSIRASVIELKNALQKEPQNASARLLLGQSFVDLGDVASAEIELKRARELGADSDRVSLLLGEARALQNRFDQVLREFPVVETAAPETKAAMIELRGRAHLALGQRVQAEEAFKAALASNEKFPDALVGLARVAATSGNIAAADDYAARAAAIAPENTKLLSFQGESAFAKKDFEAAENFYKQVLKVRKDDLTALNAQLGIGRAQIAAGKLKDASARLTQVLKLAPKHPEANFLRALAAYQSKEYELAKTHAEVALAAAPSHRQSMFIAGAANFALKQDETAFRHLTAFVNAVPTSVEGRKLLAALQQRMGNPAAAIQTLERGVGRSPEADAQLLTSAAAAKAQAGDRAGATKALAQASAARPEDAATRGRIGAMRVALGDNEGLEDLEAASEADPTGGQDAALALAALRSKEFDKALEVAERLQQKQPSNTAGYFLAAAALNRKGEPEKAKAALLKALEIKPGDIQALMSLAQLAALAGNRPEAIARLEQAVSANHESIYPRLVLARAHLRYDDPKNALMAAKAGLQRSPKEATLLDVAGRAELALGQNDAAIATFRALVAAQPNAPIAYRYLAAAYEAARDPDRALAELDNALRVAPQDPSVKFDRARLLAATGKTSEATAVLGELKAAHPQDPSIATLEGAIAQAGGRSADAVSAYQRAFGSQRTSENLVRLANAQVAAGQISEARTALEDWRKQRPNDVAVRLSLADLYLSLRELKLAEAEYAELNRAVPDSALILNNLAWTVAELGRAQEAVPLARRAAELAPNNADILDTLGTVLLRNNDAPGAVNTLRAAAQKAPASAVIQLHLAEALARSGNSGEAKDILRKLLASNDPKTDRKQAEKLLSEIGG
jgi:tetratricopeptide (TPR) repeat protein